MAEIREELERVLSETLTPDCGSLLHDEAGTGPAEWIVWQRVCCPDRPPFGFACDGCLQRAMTTERASRCQDCGTRNDPARRAVLRFEPIDGAA